MKSEQASRLKALLGVDIVSTERANATTDGTLTTGQDTVPIPALS
jgi:hypothetical protein